MIQRVGFSAVKPLTTKVDKKWLREKISFDIDPSKEIPLSRQGNSMNPLNIPSEIKKLIPENIDRTDLDQYSIPMIFAPNSVNLPELRKTLGK
jgi:hypothetical protein